ncbi:MAG TPA: hypothetical protein VE573_19265 [Nitrososphaeraceae archaeon]|jgi:hypothetical protein|nr:hypothetical protein [Nitrososphaeraceae archaeon]
MIPYKKTSWYQMMSSRKTTTTTTAFTSKQQPNISQLKIIITRRNNYAE